jgi:hypothetical protein
VLVECPKLLLIEQNWRAIFSFLEVFEFEIVSRWRGWSSIMIVRTPMNIADGHEPGACSAACAEAKRSPALAIGKIKRFVGVAKLPSVDQI